jgi:hypothetical protein
VKVFGGLTNPDAVKAGGDGLAISLSEDPSSLTIWTAFIDARTDEGRVRLGRIQSRPPGVTGGSGSRLVALASYPGVREWYVTITGPFDDGTGRVPVADLSLATTTNAGAIPPGVTAVESGRLEPWTPLDFGARLDAWWTAKRGVINVFGAPALWQDQSGNANHLTSLNGEAQPILLTGPPPGVQFDGTAWMTLASGGQLSYTRIEPFTYWFIGSITSGNCGILFKGDVSATAMRFLSGIAPNLGQVRFETAAVGEELDVQWIMPRGSPLVLVIEYDGSSSAGGVTVTQNGVKQTLNVIKDFLGNSPTSSNKFGIGALDVDSTDAGQSQPFVGIVREFGFVRGPIDASERLLLTARRSEWGF